MEIYKNYLEEFVQTHTDLHKNYTKQLETLPPGRLIGRKYKTKYQYYQLLSVNGNYTRRGIGKNDHIKKQLARKEYLTKVIPLLESNIKELRRVCDRYTPIAPEKVICKMSDIYQRSPFCSGLHDKASGRHHILLGACRSDQ